MIRPKPQEATDYALSIGFKLRGEHFCDYYESKGWLVGKSPMKNWQAAVRTWKHNAPEGSLVGQKYDPSKMEAKKRELEEFRERDYLRRRGEII